MPGLSFFCAQLSFRTLKRNLFHIFSIALPRESKTSPSGRDNKLIPSYP